MKKNDGLCYICGEKAQIAHHLCSALYDKKHRYDSDWGVPLCKKCSNSVHRGIKKMK